LVRAHAGDVGSAKPHHSRIGRQRAGEDIEQRGLAGAVGTDDADGLVGPNLEVHLFEHEERSETLVDAHGLEDRLRGARHSEDYA